MHCESEMVGVQACNSMGKAATGWPHVDSINLHSFQAQCPDDIDWLKFPEASPVQALREDFGSCLAVFANSKNVPDRVWSIQRSEMAKHAGELWRALSKDGQHEYKVRSKLLRKEYLSEVRTLTMSGISIE